MAKGQYDRPRLLTYSRIHSSLHFSNRSHPVPAGQMATQLEMTYGHFPGSQVWPDDQPLANEMRAEVMYATPRSFFKTESCLPFNLSFSLAVGWGISSHRPRDGSHMLKMLESPTSQSLEWPCGTELAPILVHLPTLRLAQINLNLVEQLWNSLCYSCCNLYSDWYSIRLAFVNLGSTLHH